MSCRTWRPPGSSRTSGSRRRSCAWTAAARTSRCGARGARTGAVPARCACRRSTGPTSAAARFAIARAPARRSAVRLRRRAVAGPAQIVARERDATGREKLTRARGACGGPDQQRRPDRAAQVSESASTTPGGGRRRTGGASSPRGSGRTYGWPRRSPRPPPMITASTSSRFTADASPAPSASDRARRPARCATVVASARAPRRRWSAASRPRSSMILNSSVFSPSCCAARAALHRAAAGVRLHAPLRPHGQRRAADADDHVADLARRAAADPRLAVEHDPAADAGAPEHAEQRARTAAPRRARTRRRWPPGRRCRARPGAAGVLEVRAQANAPSIRAGSTAPATVPARRRPRPATDADALERRRSRCRPPPPPRAAARDRRRDVGRAALVGVGWRAWPATSPASSTITAWILVPPRSMPPR